MRDDEPGILPPLRVARRPDDVFLYPALLDLHPGRIQPSLWHRLLRVVADRLGAATARCEERRIQSEEETWSKRRFVTAAVASLIPRDCEPRKEGISWTTRPPLSWAGSYAVSYRLCSRPAMRIG